MLVVSPMAEVEEFNQAGFSRVSISRCGFWDGEMVSEKLLVVWNRFNGRL
jgi:hypothetical protein